MQPNDDPYTTDSFETPYEPFQSQSQSYDDDWKYPYGYNWFHSLLSFPCWRQHCLVVLVTLFVVAVSTQGQPLVQWYNRNNKNNNPRMRTLQQQSLLRHLRTIPKRVMEFVQSLLWTTTWWWRSASSSTTTTTTRSRCDSLPELDDCATTTTTTVAPTEQPSQPSDAAATASSVPTRTTPLWNDAPLLPPSTAETTITTSTTELEPAFLNPTDYPQDWKVYHPHLGVVLKTHADAYNQQQQQKAEAYNHQNPQAETYNQNHGLPTSLRRSVVAT